MSKKKSGGFGPIVVNFEYQTQQTVVVTIPAGRTDMPIVQGRIDRVLSEARQMIVERLGELVDGGVVVVTRVELPPSEAGERRDQE
mgnify:CR=1 FL=1